MPLYFPKKSNSRKKRGVALPVVVLVTASLLAPQQGDALDGVVFQVSGQDAALEDMVRGASVLLSLDTTEPDDVFAAARSEYGRLIGALYAGGHYSPVISVKLDGREVKRRKV